MARKTKPPMPPPSKAYLVSFGDTMTTLLAFFIVLCSLAKEQTGANLYSGTGSFIRALDSFGMPGQYSKARSHRTFQMAAPNPQYLVDDMEASATDVNSLGPDDSDDRQRVVDRELEQLTRFMTEMERISEVESGPQTAAETVFDFFDALKSSPPLLPGPVKKATDQFIPLLRRDGYHVTVIVWATTPSATAWKRAFAQAIAVEEEIAATAGLKPEQRGHITSLAKPWPFSEHKRPVLSLMVQRLKSDAKR